MNIPWKIKSVIFGLIDFLNDPSALYFIQKNITKRSRITTLNVSPIWEAHKKVLEKYGATDSVFEFGVGKSLAQNLFLSNVVDKQLVVDLNPMIDFELVETARRILSEKVSLKSDIKIKNVKDLDNFGIQYCAPYDASETTLDDQSLDACISTFTLEHIPKKSIENIFKELHRKLKETGIVSAKIDYSDHYAHTDSKIPLLNYLRYDADEWKKYNHNCHYQNRLRHYDYIRIFESLGFSVVEQSLDFSEKSIPAEIVKLFEGKDKSWQATSAHIVLKKA